MRPMTSASLLLVGGLLGELGCSEENASCRSGLEHAAAVGCSDESVLEHDISSCETTDLPAACEDANRDLLNCYADMTADRCDSCDSLEDRFFNCLNDH
jgi:hypothetical protein